MRRRIEQFRVRRVCRTYDREQGKFSFNISYETTVKLTPRALVVAEAFGLGVDEAQKFTVLDTELKVAPTDIVYITGDSGSGKSVLLRALRKDLGEEAVDLSEVAVDVDKPLIETVGATVEEGLELLSKVGLNDAFLFLRTYGQLSDGQKYRYRVAKLIESKKQWWLMDEFAACLDRDTAKIIAFNLQKIARQQGKAVIAATTHGDLFEDLNPSVLVHKRFGKEIQVKYFQNRPASQCSLVKEMRIEQGTIKDWHSLSSFHYRGHLVAGPRKVFRLMRGDELCGVIVYCYPPPSCFGRRLVLPQMSMQELNEKLSIVNRVVIHPKYRTIGLGARIIRETLSLAGTPYVEMVAVMAKYNPFAEKAGLQKIVEQQPLEGIKRIAAKLSEFGFNLSLFGSERYVLERLGNLKTEEISALRDLFVANKHPRFKKEFAVSRHQPFGKTSDFVISVENADLKKIAKLIRIVGMLMQTKVYLFWEAE
ncbi:MAG: ABC transporter ATP-binding protein [Candidatus Bathyarchaeota archaeon]|nr:ABC transporter ATP-binding protein [Candidatus Bathyarchaeota archaeon]